MKIKPYLFVLCAGFCFLAGLVLVSSGSQYLGAKALYGEPETHRAPPAPEPLSFTIIPERARRGQEVELLLSRSVHNVTVFYDGRPLPKKVLDGGKVLVVTVPGDAVSHRFFELEFNGQRVQAPKPLIIIGQSGVHRAPPAPEPKVHRAPPAPGALSFTVVPDRARRGQEVKMHLSRPLHNVTVFYDGRPLPKKVLDGGKVLVVTVPGNAISHRFFELRWNGRRFRAPGPLIIIGQSGVHRAPPAPEPKVHRAPPAPGLLNFAVVPDRARRGQEVELHLSRPLHNVTVFYDGRPLPKKVLDGGKVLVVTVPGNAVTHRYFVLDWNGRRIRAPKPLIIIQ